MVVQRYPERVEVLGVNQSARFRNINNVPLTSINMRRELNTFKVTSLARALWGNKAAAVFSPLHLKQLI